MTKQRVSGQSAGGLVHVLEHLVRAFSEKSEAAQRRWQASGDPEDLRESVNWRNAMETAKQREDDAA